MALRGVQILCIGCAITGAVWGSSDFLLATVLVAVPVTPLSVLLMLYGTVGTGFIEAVIRVFSRQVQKEPSKK